MDKRSFSAMSSIWIAGGNSYEITGITYMLMKCNISVCTLNTGDRLRKGDTLILCLSSVPLLGWGRYLKIIHWIAHRYSIHLIVLCPDEIHRANIICRRNTVVVSGKCRSNQLSRLLLQAIQSCLKQKADIHCLTCACSSFWEKASRALLISAATTPDRSAAQKVYRWRSLVVQRLGLTSLIKLKLVMASQVTVSAGHKVQSAY
ncbi:hypothetical protein [Escherichia fergusonii]|uniref:hypothetical protein n=1 Tax=Escherichia fergusonii TaxID=564 RepID=UPI001F5B5E05|nr:hypothetical protein [Escherichia fergusonii]